MYLKEFNDEKTKIAIIDLCIYSARANGVVEETERMQLEEFCEEMKYPFYEIPKQEFGEAVNYIEESCSSSDKRKIIMELLSVMMSDGNCDDEELDFVKKVAGSWGIKQEDVEEFKHALTQLYMMYAKLNSLLY